MDEFISEDDLRTFEGWLRYQGVDAPTEEELRTQRPIFEEARRLCELNPKVGLMKLQSVPGEYRYAVAVQDGPGLWLTLWVRRSARGEFFVMRPVGDRDWNPHTSYHLDGTRHMKSHGRKMLTTQKHQPLTGAFSGIEELGIEGGHAPKGVGAICNPADFSGVIEVPSGVLGPMHGAVGVALVEPGHAPPDYTWAYEVVTQQIFREVTPNVVLTVMRQKSLSVDRQEVIMKDHKLNADPGQYNITGSGTDGTVNRSAESWQFFAFMFAATVTFAFELVNGLSGTNWNLTLKVVSFFALAYLILWNRRSRNWQVRLLGVWKKEHYS